MDSEPRVRVKAISAKTLTSHGYAVCLFPEQPLRRTVEEQDRAIEERIEKKHVKPLEAPLKLDKIRLYWRNRLVYLIAFIYFSLSLNNLYHFPMKIYRYGLTFFVPYTVATIFIGFPLHVLQTSMGQYAQYGIFWVWQCAPTFFGLGISLLLIYIFISLYYTMFGAYSLVYFAHCFTNYFPWTYCSAIQWTNQTNETCFPHSWYISENATLPSKDFFYNVVLNTPYRYPPEVWGFKSFKWWLFASLIFSWLFVYVATLRSSRTIGKFSIFGVVFSYFTFLSLLIIAIQMKHDGKLFLHVKSDEMSVFNVGMWCSAIMQVLLELGLCFGIPILYGSYCRFRNFFILDSIILCSINYFNSILCFYLFFSFIKTFSCNIDYDRWKLPDNTVGILYIVYSEAFAGLPSGQYWCLLFFLTVFLLIMGTQIALIEGILGAIYENSSFLLKYHWFVNLLICTTFCAFGSLFCFSNGYFLTLIFYYFPTFFNIIPLSVLILVGLVFLYGFENYSRSMKLMRDYDVFPIIRIFFIGLVIVFVIVFIITILVVDSIIFTGNLSYHELYGKVCWALCGIIYSPFVIWIIICFLVFWYLKMNILKPTETWTELEDDKETARLQYTNKYSPSYTWSWNRYR